MKPSGLPAGSPRFLGRDAEIRTSALSLLARAVDAMSRTEPNGVSTEEWDAVVVEGTALLQRSVAP